MFYDSGLSVLNFTEEQVKPQSHIHDFGPGRATVYPDLASG